MRKRSREEPTFAFHFHLLCRFKVPIFFFPPYFFPWKRTRTTPDGKKKWRGEEIDRKTDCEIAKEMNEEQNRQDKDGGKVEKEENG